MSKVKKQQLFYNKFFIFNILRETFYLKTIFFINF